MRGQRRRSVFDRPNRRALLPRTDPTGTGRVSTCRSAPTPRAKARAINSPHRDIPPIHRPAVTLRTILHGEGFELPHRDIQPTQRSTLRPQANSPRAGFDPRRRDIQRTHRATARPQTNSHDRAPICCDAIFKLPQRGVTANEFAQAASRPAATRYSNHRTEVTPHRVDSAQAFASGRSRLATAGLSPTSRSLGSLVSWDTRCGD
jgi:hypothetical protein